MDVHVEGEKTKKFIDPDIVMMYLLQKEFMEDYLCLYKQREVVPHETMIKRMVESILVPKT